MKRIEKMISESRPALLYHYTDQQGLLGILNNRAIWATAVGYLNDSSEFRHAREVARTVLNARIANANLDDKTLLYDLLATIDTTGGNICVTSFSVQGDSLSQWRAYSGSGAGYAIGFDSKRLDLIAKANECKLAKCIYDDKAQFEFIDAIVETSLVENRLRKDEPVEGDDVDDLVPGGDFAYRINRYACVLKNGNFSSEEEWRLISRGISYRRMQYRPGRSTIVPYRSIDLADSEGKMPVAEIVIGPTPQPEQAGKAVFGLLYASGLKPMRISIRQSSIPFRNW